MKNAQMDRLGRMQRQYHKHHPWRLSANGLYIPHVYTEAKHDGLSYWDDVGFILNGRRVIVWWQHPRDVYSGEIEHQSWLEAGPGPQARWLSKGRTKNYRRVGSSRKKIVSYTLSKPSEEQSRHYDHLRDIRKRLAAEGIDRDVPPSWKWERLTWAMGVSLVAPLEVRNESEVASLASLARRLILGETTLGSEFPDYCYGRAAWLSEKIEVL